MVYAPKKNVSSLQAGKYGNLTNHSTQRHHQGNECKRGFDVERVRASWALHSLWSKKKLVPETSHETNLLTNESKEQWIDDYVERETTVARKRVENSETAIKQEQDDIRNAENAGLTSRKSEKSFEDRLNAIGDCPSDLASSDEEEDTDNGEDNEYTELGKPSRDDEPGWVMGTISKTVMHRMERYR